MGKLDALQNSVGKARCDRCGFMFPIEELIEETRTGVVVDKKCLDELSFEETRREQPAQRVNHHFDT